MHDYWQKISLCGVLILVVILVLCCSDADKTETKTQDLSIKLDTTKQTQARFTDFKAFDIPLEKDSTISYNKIKSNITAQRQSLAQTSVFPDSLATIFENNLVQKIFPYWYGMTWSFEGHSNIPNQGEIACGYFVSTTLKHIGLPLNRYRLAQQSPIHEAKTLSLNQTVFEIENVSSAENINAIKATTQAGIYFIGFDASHVGFLLKRKGALFLIHSNYLGDTGVCIERIEDSEVFAAFQKFYLVSLSHNQELLQKWLKQEKIEIITG